MTHHLSTTISTLILVAGLNLATEDATGQVSMQFRTIKDTQITGYAVPDGGNEQLNHLGGADSMRVLKYSQDVTIMDFDTDAMATFLAENPGTATWTLNIYPSTHFFTLPTSDEFMPTILTIESTNDWTELLINGSGNQSPLDWGPEESAATYFYAQTLLDINGELDVAGSLGWVDPDSGPYTFTSLAPIPSNGVPALAPDGLTWDRNPTPEFENSKKFLRSDVNLAQAFGDFASVEMDQAIIQAMINDENNRGLRFGPIVPSEFPAYNNTWGIWSKDVGGSDALAAFLEVTITPAGEGDFDGDGDVDGADFLKWQRDLGDAPNLALWQNNYGNSSPIASAVGVPEPSSLLLLLAVGSTMLVTRMANQSRV